MCLIIVAADPAKRPSDETLEIAQDGNPNGIGVAWWTGDEWIHWRKGLTLPQLRAFLKDCRAGVIIHFRLASVGGTKKGLCHPFPIEAEVPLSLEGKAHRVLMHNGHWSQWKERLMDAFIRQGTKVPNEAWSDSRAMAWLANQYGENILTLIDEKVVVFSGKGKLRYYGSGWTTENGITYSNAFWKYRTGGVSALPASSYDYRNRGTYADWDKKRQRELEFVGSCGAMTE